MVKKKIQRLKILFAQTRDVEAEVAEAIKFLQKRKHFDKRSWKWKQTRTFDFSKSRKQKYFHKTWGRDVEAKVGSS